jgi:Peroxiredoxin
MEDGPLRGLLARAVIVINPEGKVIYTEIVTEITTEPNYDAVINLLK